LAQLPAIQRASGGRCFRLRHEAAVLQEAGYLADELGLVEGRELAVHAEEVHGEGRARAASTADEDQVGTARLAGARAHRPVPQATSWLAACFAEAHLLAALRLDVCLPCH